MQTLSVSSPQSIGVDVNSQEQGPLLSQRAAIVFVLGTLAGLSAGVLTAFNGGSPAAALLAGGAAGAGAVLFFYTIIG